MNTIKQIIEIAGYESVDDMEVGDRIKVEGGSYMDLTIEKVFSDQISVAHYYTQRGDLMSDPEIVFEIYETHWIPIRYTQHPNVHKYDEDGLPDVKKFAEMWSSNLRRQGFIKKAEKQEVVQ